MSAQPGKVCPNCFNAIANCNFCSSCGYNLQAPADTKSHALPPFTLLHDRYLLGRVLGSGGFGITYIALDINDNSKCAVKEYFPFDLCSRNMQTGFVMPTSRDSEFPAGLARFSREAAALRSLSKNPYIVSFTDYIEANGTCYMVMEYVDGKSLKVLARERGGRLPFDIVYNCFLNTALALSQVHASGIIHRDISPENILIMENGETKLIDFGAALVQLHGSQRDPSVVLKPGFAPPEQYHLNGYQGPWTDIYALACTFYRLVTGIPIPPAPQRQSGASVPDMHTVQPGTPRHVSFAIEKAMRLDVRERYACMDDFIEDITAYYDNHSTHQPPSSSGAGSAYSPYESTPDPKVRIWQRGRSQRQPYITIVSGTNVGMRVEMQDGVPVRIGRLYPSCDLIPGNDPHISRIHCVLTYDSKSGCVLLEDTSSNGTFLPESGRSIKRGEILALQDTTLVQLAASGSIIKVVMV